KLTGPGRSRQGRLTQHSSQERECALLVEQLVQVPAFGRLYARGAAALARAAGEHPRGVADPAFEGVEAASRDPDAAGMPVVDEDGRRSRLVVDVGRESA